MTYCAICFVEIETDYLVLGGLCPACYRKDYQLATEFMQLLDSLSESMTVHEYHHHVEQLANTRRKLVRGV